MDIWHYDQHTKTLIGQGKADQSPLEPGVFLVPALATNISPPEAPEGCSIVFTGGGWAVEEIAFLPPDPALNLPPAPAMPTITARQFRLALLGLGLTEAQITGAWMEALML